MKRTLFTALLLGAATQFGTAAVTVLPYNLSLSPATAQIVTDGTGKALDVGVWAVGLFPASTDFMQADVHALLTTFDQNGSARPFAAQDGVIGALGNAGVTDAATSLDGSDPFTGTPIFVVIGNAASLAEASEVIILQGPAWPQEAELVGANISFPTWTSTIVRGMESPPVSGLTGPAAQFNGTIGMTFIPEPSAALLGLLGLAGFIRRRR